MIATASPALRTPPGSSSLADVLDLILDKGIVIDAYVRVSLVGIELLTVDARVVIASVDTYLRWAEAVHRLVLQNPPRELPDMVTGGGPAGKAKKALGMGDGSKEEEEEDEAEEDAKERRKGNRKENRRGLLAKLTGRKKKGRASRKQT